MAVYSVNSSADVVALLNDIEIQPTDPPSLYLDIEGVSLSRHGSISIVQLFNMPTNRVFLIDVFVLQQAAFDTPNGSGTTLRSILEAKLIPKVFFDVRNDSDALFAHFHISLRGIHDVQLLKAATQPWVPRLAGLRQCIEQDAQLSADELKDWQTVKATGKKLFTVEDGGSYEIFNVRPLKQDIINYCTQDVVHLPFLWVTYSERLSKSWLKRAKEETTNRVLLSQAESYVPNGDYKVWSPWAKNVKGESSNGSRKDHARKTKGNRLPLTEYQKPKEHMGVQQLFNTKPANRQAGKVPSVQSSLPLSAGRAEQQASKQSTNIIVAPLSESVPTVKNELKVSHDVLPIRGKGKAKAKQTEQVRDKQRTPLASTAWICSTCNREMLASQRDAHVVGKAHVARTTQATNAASNVLSLLSISEGDNSQTAEISKTKNGTAKAKAKAEAASKKPKTGGTSSKGTHYSVRAAVTSTYPPHEGTADCGFVGFNQGFSLSGSYRDDLCLGGGDNYGLCDKECGWCGYCIDNVDI